MIKYEFSLMHSDSKGNDSLIGEYDSLIDASRAYLDVLDELQENMNLSGTVSENGTTIKQVLEDGTVHRYTMYIEQYQL